MQKKFLRTSTKILGSVALFASAVPTLVCRGAPGIEYDLTKAYAVARHVASTKGIWRPVARFTPLPSHQRHTEKYNPDTDSWDYHVTDCRPVDPYFDGIVREGKKRMATLTQARQALLEYQELKRKFPRPDSPPLDQGGIARAEWEVGKDANSLFVCV